MPASPPKPWEQGGANAGGSTATPISATATNVPISTGNSGAGTGHAPTVPNRPATLQTSTLPSSTGLASPAYPYSSAMSRFSNPYSSYTGGFGSTYTSPYYGGGGGGGGYGTSYSSPYYNSGYGGSYGMGGYGVGGYRPYGAMAGPTGPNPLQASTQAAFELLNSFVQSFGSFAAMLDSTLHATFSSFHAMMAVADQVGSLRTYLGQVFSIMVIVRKLRRWLIRFVTGRDLVNAEDLVADFDAAAASSKDLAHLDSGLPRLQKKPILIFVALVFGFPYLLNKLVQFLSARLMEKQQQQQLTSLDPSNMEFVRALYDFQASSPMELSFKRGDIIAVLEKPVDPATNEALWWRGMLESGPSGFFPSTYTEVIKKAASAPTGATSSQPTANSGQTVASLAQDLSSSSFLGTEPAASRPQ